VCVVCVCVVCVCVCGVCVCVSPKSAQYFSSGRDLSIFAMPNVVSYKNYIIFIFIIVSVFITPNINCIILRNLWKRLNGCINKNVSDIVYFTVVGTM